MAVTDALPAPAAARLVLIYALALTVVTLVPGVLGTFGARYLAAAIALDVVFCGLAARLWRRPGTGRAGLLCHYSLLYLALLFSSIAAAAAIN